MEPNLDEMAIAETRLAENERQSSITLDASQPSGMDVDLSHEDVDDLMRKTDDERDASMEIVVEESVTVMERVEESAAVPVNIPAILKPSTTEGEDVGASVIGLAPQTSDIRSTVPAETTEPRNGAASPRSEADPLLEIAGLIQEAQQEREPREMMVESTTVIASSTSIIIDTATQTEPQVQVTSAPQAPVQRAPAESQPTRRPGPTPLSLAALSVSPAATSSIPLAPLKSGPVVAKSPEPFTELWPERAAPVTVVTSAESTNALSAQLSADVPLPEVQSVTSKPAPQSAASPSAQISPASVPVAEASTSVSSVPVPVKETAGTVPLTLQPVPNTSGSGSPAPQSVADSSIPAPSAATTSTEGSAPPVASASVPVPVASPPTAPTSAATISFAPITSAGTIAPPTYADGETDDAEGETDPDLTAGPLGPGSDAEEEFMNGPSASTLKAVDPGFTDYLQRASVISRGLGRGAGSGFGTATRGTGAKSRGAGRPVGNGERRLIVEVVLQKFKRGKFRPTANDDIASMLRAPLGLAEGEPVDPDLMFARSRGKSAAMVSRSTSILPPPPLVIESALMESPERDVRQEETEADKAPSDRRHWDYNTDEGEHSADLEPPVLAASARLKDVPKAKRPAPIMTGTGAQGMSMWSASRLS